MMMATSFRGPGGASGSDLEAVSKSSQHSCSACFEPNACSAHHLDARFSNDDVEDENSESSIVSTESTLTREQRQEEEELRLQRTRLAAARERYREFLSRRQSQLSQASSGAPPLPCSASPELPTKASSNSNLSPRLDAAEDGLECREDEDGLRSSVSKSVPAPSETVQLSQANSASRVSPPPSLCFSRFAGGFSPSTAEASCGSAATMTALEMEIASIKLDSTLGDVERSKKLKDALADYLRRKSGKLSSLEVLGGAPGLTPSPASSAAVGDAAETGIVTLAKSQETALKSFAQEVKASKSPTFLKPASPLRASRGAAPSTQEPGFAGIGFCVRRSESPCRRGCGGAESSLSQLRDVYDLQSHPATASSARYSPQRFRAGEIPSTDELGNLSITTPGSLRASCRPVQSPNFSTARVSYLSPKNSNATGSTTSHGHEILSNPLSVTFSEQTPTRPSRRTPLPTHSAPGACGTTAAPAEGRQPLPNRSEASSDHRFPDYSNSAKRDSAVLTSASPADKRAAGPLRQSSQEQSGLTPRHSGTAVAKSFTIAQALSMLSGPNAAPASRHVAPHPMPPQSSPSPSPAPNHPKDPQGCGSPSPVVGPLSPSPRATLRRSCGTSSLSTPSISLRCSPCAAAQGSSVVAPSPRPATLRSRSPHTASQLRCCSPGLRGEGVAPHRNSGRSAVMTTPTARQASPKAILGEPPDRRPFGSGRRTLPSAWVSTQPVWWSVQTTEEKEPPSPAVAFPASATAVTSSSCASTAPRAPPSSLQAFRARQRLCAARSGNPGKVRQPLRRPEWDPTPADLQAQAGLEPQSRPSCSGGRRSSVCSAPETPGENMVLPLPARATTPVESSAPAAQLSGVVSRYRNRSSGPDAGFSARQSDAGESLRSSFDSGVEPALGADEPWPPVDPLEEASCSSLAESSCGMVPGPIAAQSIAFSGLGRTLAPSPMVGISGGSPVNSSTTTLRRTLCTLAPVTGAGVGQVHADPISSLAASVLWPRRDAPLVQAESQCRHHGCWGPCESRPKRTAWVPLRKPLPDPEEHEVDSCGSDSSVTTGVSSIPSFRGFPGASLRARPSR
eukprot:RCo046821